MRKDCTAYNFWYSVNKCADGPEERKWSFVLSTMDGQSGDLYTSMAASLHQAAAGSSNICCTVRRTICFIYVLAHPLLANRCGESCQFCGAKKGVKPDMSRIN
jgi:hypothetical protein